MTPEEAHALITRIDLLEAYGKKLLNPVAAGEQTAGTPSKPVQHYKVSAWLGEIAGLATARFAGNAAFTSRADELMKADLGKDGEYAYWTEPVRTALDLLDTFRAFVFIDSPGTASDALKTLVEQTVRDGYFKSWPFKSLLAVFGLLITCFFGGTVYLGLQVPGVARQAEEARTAIQSARDTAKTDLADAVKTVNENALRDARAQMAKLQGTIDDVAKIVADLHGHADKAVSDLDQEIQRGETAIRTARNAIAASPNQLDGDIDRGRARITAAVDTAIAGLPGIIGAYVSAKKPETDQLIADDIKRQLDVSRQKISADIQTVDALRQTFEHQVEIAQTELPRAAKLADTRAAAFNDIVERYTGPIDDILRRLSGTAQVTGMTAVAAVLGHAYWIIIFVSVAAWLGLIHLLVSLIVWFFRQLGRTGSAAGGALPTI